MTQLSGKVVAITGAGSGIGRALAIELAGRGCDLALSDVDEDGLAQTASSCATPGVTVSTDRVDVADRAAVADWADRVVDDHGRVNVIVNNAGVSLSYDVSAMSLDDLEWLMGVNFWGVVHGTKAFLPHLEASGDGHVVNISSVFGLISVPSQSGYNAAKFAVRGFTDALRIELESGRSCVSATTVHPGGVRTNIARNGRIDPNGLAARSGGDPAAAFDRIARTSAEQAAAAIVRGVERNRRRIVIGADAKVIDLVSRLPAAVYQRPVILGGRLARRFGTSA